MANKRLFQFLYSKQPKLTCITGQMNFRSQGRVVGSATGLGVYSVVGYGNGKFQIKCNDNYVALVGAEFTPLTGISATGTNISAVVGSAAYQITVVGNNTTANWQSAGLDSDYGTAAVGQIFVANDVIGSGTGTCKQLIPSNISTVEVLNGTANMLTNTSPNYGSNTGGQGRGSSIFFQTLAPVASMVSSASLNTMTVTNPVASSSMMFKLWFRDSSST